MRIVWGIWVDIPAGTPMQIELKKSSGKPYCRPPRCKRNSDYIDSNGRIKKDTVCCKITIRTASGSRSAFFCRECLEKIHDEIREKLNPKLWIFS